MNWLAHLHLARCSDAAMFGALLGDFVRGRSGLNRFGTVEHREILLHRRVDRFTDTHAAVSALRSRFPEGRRRYAGIVLDVYFDHCLARDWDRWSDVPLAAFSARVYAMLHERRAMLPERLRAVAPRMAAGDWLGGYRERDNVDRTVIRIASRLSRNGEVLVACLDELRRLEPAADAAFPVFYPELSRFAAAARSALVASMPLP